jgi:hypothetical protein
MGNEQSAQAVPVQKIVSQLGTLIEIYNFLKDLHDANVTTKMVSYCPNSMQVVFEAIDITPALGRFAFKIMSKNDSRPWSVESGYYDRDGKYEARNAKIDKFKKITVIFRSKEAYNRLVDAFFRCKERSFPQAKLFEYLTHLTHPNVSEFQQSKMKIIEGEKSHDFSLCEDPMHPYPHIVYTDYSAEIEIY